MVSRRQALADRLSQNNTAAPSGHALVDRLSGNNPAAPSGQALVDRLSRKKTAAPSGQALGAKLSRTGSRGQAVADGLADELSRTGFQATDSTCRNLLSGYTL